MQILVSIDDTDDLESPGTGEVAEQLAEGVVAKGWGSCTPVTRHQLLLDPSIPYTSHNSSMCFGACIEEGSLAEVIAHCSTELAARSVLGSDPGLCVAVPERLAAAELLIAFGRRAKREVLRKVEAYALAAEMGIHLSEHGGSGQGVIGALAGAGLRLSGNDGRFKGKLKVPSTEGWATVLEIRKAGIDRVRTLEGASLEDAESVRVGNWVKPVLQEGACVLLVVPGDEGWKACDRKLFQEY